MDSGRVVFNAAKLSILSWQPWYIIFSDRKISWLGIFPEITFPQLDSSLMQSLLENCFKLEPSNSHFWNEDDGRNSIHHRQSIHGVCDPRTGKEQILNVSCLGHNMSATFIIGWSHPADPFVGLAQIKSSLPRECSLIVF